ncbi:hypothetical protein U1Q18_032862 [Sarracenia purpurea var. burkii]
MGEGGRRGEERKRTKRRHLTTGTPPMFASITGKGERKVRQGERSEGRHHRWSCRISFTAKIAGEVLRCSSDLLIPASFQDLQWSPTSPDSAVFWCSSFT